MGRWQGWLGILTAGAVMACSPKAPVAPPTGYSATFQADDQKNFGQFNQPADPTRRIEGLWSQDKSQCHKGFVLDRADGYGTYTVDTSPKGLGTFEERIDEVHSIFLHKDWVGRYYLNGNTLILLSAGGNRIQRASYTIVSFGTDSIGYEKKGLWTYDLWEGTLLSASTTGPGSLVRCETADINAAYLASDPDLAKRIESFRLDAKARDAEAAKREVEASKVFQDQKRFDTWLGQKKAEYKADLADSVLRQPPLLADQRYWIIGSSVAVGTVRLGAVQTTYARMRFQSNDKECLTNNACPEYLLVMRDVDASRLLKQNTEIRALVGKMVGIVNSAAGTQTLVFEPVEIYAAK